MRFNGKSLCALIFLLMLFAPACQNKQAGEQGNQHRGVGVVVRVEAQNKLIELNHEEIPNYMPAMQMEYHVRDASILESLKPGDKVEFTVEENNGIEVITAIKKL